jgi:hypothetical protein
MRTSLLLPVVYLALAGCAEQAPPQMTTTTYNPATTTTTTYAAPAMGAPYTPIGSSTTYMTPSPSYIAPTTTTTVVRTP